MSGWGPEPTEPTRDWDSTWGDGRDQEAKQDFARARKTGVRVAGTLLVAALGAAIAVTVLSALPPLPSFTGIVFPSQSATQQPAASGAVSIPSAAPALVAAAVAPAMALVTTWSEDSSGLTPGACGFSGSGALLANGYVLTANHVIAEDNSIDVPAACDWENVLVMFIDSAEDAPSRAYKAEIVATDERRDVALLKITEAVAGAPDISTLPALTIYSETNSPTLGMQLVFMGYPGVGGDTLSLSTGMVSGYDQLKDGTRTLKTDAVLSGGSSGGPGIDGTGRIVGIVMQAGSPSASDFTDCRPYDTNGNGYIDANDGCMQVGGQFVTLLDCREIVTFLTENGHADLVNGGRN